MQFEKNRASVFLLRQFILNLKYIKIPKQRLIRRKVTRAQVKKTMRHFSQMVSTFTYRTIQGENPNSKIIKTLGNTSKLLQCEHDVVFVVYVVRLIFFPCTLEFQLAICMKAFYLLYCHSGLLPLRVSVLQSPAPGLSRTGIALGWGTRTATMRLSQTTVSAKAGGLAQF